MMHDFAMENFDTICINSQDGDTDGTQKTVVQEELQNNCDKLSPTIILNKAANHTRIGDTNLLSDESSNVSDDDVHFITEISKPLLNSDGNRQRLRNRIQSRRRQKWLKATGICLVVSVFAALLLLLAFMLVPQRFLSHIVESYADDGNVIGCDEITVENVWIRKLPLMLSEGSIRLLRVNDDDVLDVILPFGTVVSSSNRYVCEIYFPGQKRCFGGVLALDGLTGQFLWRYDSVAEMYALTCSEDLNNDGWNDCVGAGRFGAFAAINGRDGSELWAFDKNPSRNGMMNLYTPQFIDDVDSDGVRDIVQIHGGDPVAEPTDMNRLVAKVMVFSGRTGRTLVEKNVPDNHESYYSPQILNLGDGLKTVLFGTGGETFPGNFYASNLNDLLWSESQKLESATIYEGVRKGIMTPPILVDLNLDGREDIVICPFGDECLAIDGLSLEIIWKFSEINNSETYVTPAVGFYNSDNVPDIFVQLFVGLGYPVYFYGETLILDGRNGKILKKLPRSNNVVTTSPLTISIEGFGNDLFLYWLQLCRGHENEIVDTPFQNLPQYILSRAHICKIRFNTTTDSLYLVHGRSTKNKPVKYGLLYDSRKYYHEEYDNQLNLTIMVEKFLIRYPRFRRYYEQYKQKLEVTDLSKTGDEYIRRLNDNKDYHKNLLQSQRRHNDIDLHDTSIHDTIDFSSPTSHPKRYDYNTKDMKDESNSDNGYDTVVIRKKRHNGPHDAEGQQRLIGTGTLAPSNLPINDQFYNNSIDVIFSTYWSKPMEILLQTEKEIKCNEKWLNEEYQRFRPESKFFRYDHDHYLTYGNQYCAKKYGRRIPPSNVEMMPSMFNVHYGCLTVYRQRLRCTCSPGRVSSYQRCSRILPLHLQRWPAYLGLSGNGYWNSSMLYTTL